MGAPDRESGHDTIGAAGDTADVVSDTADVVGRGVLTLRQHHPAADRSNVKE